MIGADLVALVAFASVPVAAAFGVLSIAQLVTAALLAGTADVFFVSAYRAFLPTLVHKKDLLAGDAMLQGSGQAAQLAGQAWLA